MLGEFGAGIGRQRERDPGIAALQQRVGQRGVEAVAAGHRQQMLLAAGVGDFDEVGVRPVDARGEPHAVRRRSRQR